MYRLTGLLGTGAIALTMALTPAVAAELEVPGIYEQSVATGDRVALGRSFYQAGRFAEAAAAWQAAAQTYANKGDRENQALSLSYLSLAYQELGQWDGASSAVAASIEILRSGDRVEAILLGQALNTQGSILLARGKAQEALETWKRSESLYQEAADETGVLGSKINQARALQSLGFYRRAESKLLLVAAQMDDMPDSVVKVSGLRSLSIALQVVGKIKASQEILTESLQVAQRIGATAEVSRTLLSLGNAAVDLQEPDRALEYFQRASQAAMNPEDRRLAELNKLRVYVKLKQWQQASTIVEKLPSELLSLPPSRMAIENTVNFAESVLHVERQGQQIDWSGTNRLLAAAVRSAQTIQDGRAEAQALAKWGQLYAQNGQSSEAIDLTQQSLNIAQNLQAADLVAIAAGQLGREQVKLGRREEAIASYSQAVRALQSLRQDMAAINRDVQFDFRETVEPVYRELVRLLLPPLDREDQEVSQENLQQARELIESLQLAELDNFFREACLDATTVAIDRIDPKATAIYPIILSDRLAVIVSSPDRPLSYYATPSSQAQIENTLKEFIIQISPLYDEADRLQLSQTIYDWLLRPAEAAGELAGTETLVFVLDGILRNVPMAALHDGKQYLVEKYNLALSPGLQLIETRSPESAEMSLIVGGLSAARQGFSALPQVEKELAEISQKFPAQVLLNEEFTRNTVVEQVDKNQSRIVHLATHGQFSSKAEDTFLLTWDSRLQVQELDSLLQRRAITEVGAIELLVLSACETAAGDDRAVLGLAGIAVKSGARSTLATLWRVRDRSTALFMTEFYQQLQTPGVTKAAAMRRAQLALLADPEYSEPFFWAPFVLVGSWL